MNRIPTEIRKLEMNCRRVLESVSKYNEAKREAAPFVIEANLLFDKYNSLKECGEISESEKAHNEYKEADGKVKNIYSGYMKHQDDYYNQWVWEKEVYSHYKWWDDFAPSTIEERNMRYETMKLLNELLKCFSNVSKLMQLGYLVDNDVLPWAVDARTSRQEEGSDVVKLYESKMDKLYKSDYERWKDVKIYFDAYNNGRTNEDLAQQFAISERTVSRRILAGEEFATRALDLPRLPCPPHRLKKQGA